MTPEQFWATADHDADSGCWTWSGNTNNKGYGQAYVRGVRTTNLAHRVAYLLRVGPIEGRLQVDHLCRNRRCINPDHLELVTNRENTKRGIGPAILAERNRQDAEARTHCSQGHPYDEANTYRLPSRPTWRYCLTCKREQARQRYASRAVTKRQVAADVDNPGGRGKDGKSDTR